MSHTCDCMKSLFDPLCPMMAWEGDEDIEELFKGKTDCSYL